MVRCFLERPSTRIWFFFFSNYTGVMCFRDKEDRVMCNFYHIVSRVHIIIVTYHCWGWPWSPGWDSACQPGDNWLWNYFFSTPVHCVLYGGKSLWEVLFLSVVLRQLTSLALKMFMKMQIPRLYTDFLNQNYWNHKSRELVWLTMCYIWE